MALTTAILLAGLMISAAILATRFDLFRPVRRLASAWRRHRLEDRHALLRMAAALATAAGVFALLYPLMNSGR